MFLTCIYVTITDIKNNIIQNKILLLSFIFGIFCNIAYYGFLYKEFFLTFVLNVLILSAISIIFYAMHFWAAGDSKMLISIIFLFPARIYYTGENISPAVSLIIIIFSLAFIYSVIESIIIGISRKDLFNFKSINLNIKEMILQYIKCSCVISLINIFVFLISPNFYSENKALLMIFNMVIIFLIYNVKILNKGLPLLFLCFVTIVSYVFVNGFVFAFNLDFIIYIFTAFILFLRIISEKYCYLEIPTASTKKGMVLAYSTVLNFQPSAVKGLPKSTTEDVRSKITQEQVDSILRWEKTKFGQPTITIVRKIPFAIFITLGVFIFLFLRVFVL